MNQRDTDLMTIYANLKITKSQYHKFTAPQANYSHMVSAYKRIEDYIRSYDPDDYDQFHSQNMPLPITGRPPD